MQYDAELKLLTDFFRRAGSSVNIVNPNEPVSKYLDKNPLSSGVASDEQLSTPLRQFLPEILPDTVYSVTDRLSLKYIYLLLPGTEDMQLLSIGPYLEKEMSDQDILELAESLELQPAQQKILQKYYTSLPVISPESPIQHLLVMFYEQLWGSDGFTYATFSREALSGFTSFRQKALSSEDISSQWNVDMIEKRYAGENAMMDAVRTGNLKKVDTHIGRITAAVFDKRLPDHLRTLKNYCIITNTLLRKAAEQGGVHPVYLDSVSADFAAKIEQMASPAACPAMIGSIARSYCRLVKNHSAKSYSPSVQKAMICVDADLSAPLSLRYLADELNINSSYLSSLFKKETGITVTTYIIRQRINYAKHLLENTRLQIQTVAQYCGLGDVHYFSKLFKKETGLTPREFRQSVQ